MLDLERCHCQEIEEYSGEVMHYREPYSANLDSIGVQRRELMIVLESTFSDQLASSCHQGCLLRLSYLSSVRIVFAASVTAAAVCYYLPASYL